MRKTFRVSDLAVGDWVKVDIHPTPRRIASVNIEWSDDGGYVILQGVVRKFKISVIEPIPITPEILKKNEVYVRWFCVAADPIGALLKDDETYHTKCEKFYKCSDFVIHSTLRGEKFGRWQFATNDERRGFKGRTVLANINYVHELQQALRLAGINKEIVL